MKRMLVGVTVDRSNSMVGNTAAVVQGYAQFVEQLSKEPAPVRLSLFLFCGEFEPVYLAQPLGAVKPLNTESYVADGSGTALYDAILDTITAMEAQEPDDRAVIVAVLTDGEENCSDATEKAVAARIAVKQALGWRFLILGADESYTAKLGRRLGIPAKHVKSFKADPAGVVAGFLTMAGDVKGLLSGQ